jgi:hypothetical protein
VTRWQSWQNPDAGLATLLALLTLYILVFIPLYGTPFGGKGVLGISFSMILLAGVFATSYRSTMRVWIAVFAALSFSSHWMQFILSGYWTHIIDVAFTCLFFCALGYVTIRRVFAAGEVNVYRILGAIAGYLLIGLIFANAFILIQLLSPEAFQQDDMHVQGVEPLPALLYFSFATLTTVGYGDIAPLAPAARSLAMLEALIGQLYPAILIARLVTQYRADRAP